MQQNIPYQQMSTGAQNKIIYPMHLYLGKKTEHHNKSEKFN